MLPPKSEFLSLSLKNRDVHDDSKGITLPITREIFDRYVKCPIKAPWYVDLLNLNSAFGRDVTRLTDNPDFVVPAGGM